MSTDTAVPQRSPSLGNEVLSGTRWSIVASLVRQGVRFINTLILARYFLSPEAFGLMAMTLVVTDFAGLLSDAGTGRALVATEEVSDSLAHSVFWLNLGIALGLALGIYFGAEWLATGFAEPRAITMFEVLALAPLLSSMRTVPVGLLQRRLHFRSLAVCEIASGFGFVLISLLLAASGAGVWSLVVATLVSLLTEAVGLSFQAGYWPRAHFSGIEISRIWSFSSHLTLFNLANYLFQNLDRILIGRYLGASALGVFFLANRLVEFTVRFLLRRVLTVVFPALARVSEDSERLRAGLLRAAAGIALVLFPLLAGIGAVGDSFVTVALSPRWAETAVFLPLLGVRYIAEALVRVGGVLYSVKERTDLQLYWGLAFGLACACSVVAGLPWGLYGVVAGRTIAVVGLLYIALRLPLRLIDLSVVRFARELVPYAFGTLLMVFSVYGVLSLGHRVAVPEVALLAIGIVVGGGVYGATLLVFRPAALSDLRRLAVPGRG